MSHITPISDAPSAADVAADLHALADLIANDGDGFLAAVVAKLFTESMWPAHAVSYSERGQEREVMAEAVRRFKSIATGPISKVYEGGGEGYFNAIIPLNALQLKLVDLRARVCERIVTGVETVTEQVPDPAAPKITVERVVEQVEWRCSSILADAEAVQA